MSDDLNELLAASAPRSRARSTRILIATLLVLAGMIVGVVLGRATAPTSIPSGGPASPTQQQ